ncbi:tryptophan-rich sensory protein [bacterium]|nr:tryptophan-rich sensory protein [bacterium]
MQKAPQTKAPTLRHTWLSRYIEEGKRYQGPAWLRYGVLGAWLVMTLLNVFSFALLPMTVQQVSQLRTPLYLDPAPYAFSIWGLLFAALGAYAVYQWLPFHPRGALLAETRVPMLVSFVCGILWPVAVGFVQMPLALLLIVGMLASAAVAYQRFKPEAAHGMPQRLCVSWPLGLYLGWLSLATVVSLAGVLTDDLGLRSVLLSSVAWSAIAILGLGGLGAVLGYRKRDWAFNAALGWGLIAIAGEQRTPPIGWAVVFAIALMAFGLIAGSRRRTPPRSMRDRLA